MATFILPFEKMHGLGNDFVLVHYKYLPHSLSEEELAKKLCDRNFGIGADGLIIVKPGSEGGDFAWSYINSDGSTSQMCGNGIRCFAKYVFDRGLTNKSEFEVETLAGIIKPSVQENGEIKVNMGPPILEPNEIPIKIPEGEAKRIIDYPIQAHDKEFLFTPVSMGNPHAIAFLDSEDELNDLDLERYGKAIENHPYFPEKTNVEFAFVRDSIQHSDYIDLRVWERGCGATLACGTGACATVVAAQIKNLVSPDKPITVKLPGGELLIEWNKLENAIFMTGPAKSVFIGQIELEV